MPSDRARNWRWTRRGGFLQRGLMTTGTRLLDLPSRYGLHLLVAARLSVADVGAFYIVFSTMTLAAGFGRLGIDRALTREVASALGRGQPDAARHAVWRAFLLTMVQSVAVAGLLALIASPLANHVLHKPGLVLPLVLGALTIVPQNISTFAAGALAGLGRVPASQMVYSWLWPALFCVCAVLMPLNVQRTLLLIGGSLVVNAAIGLALMLRSLPGSLHGGDAGAEKDRLYRVGISFFTLELVQLSFSSLPPFALGIYATTVDVGRYALAWRIVLVLNLLVAAIAAMAAPQFARLNAAGERAALARVAAQSVALSVVMAGVPAVLLAMRPVFLLNFFGHGYAPAAPLLRLLLVGQTAAVLCTAMPDLLGMTGHARALFRINAVSLVLLIAMLFMLTPHHGPEGAAIAVSLTMVLNCIAVTLTVKKDLGFYPLLAWRGLLGRDSPAS